MGKNSYAEMTVVERISGVSLAKQSMLIDAVKARLYYRALLDLPAASQISRSENGTALLITPSTMSRRKAAGYLRRDESDRVVRLAGVIDSCWYRFVYIDRQYGACTDMATKPPSEQELLDGLDAYTTDDDELALSQPQGLTPLERLKGSVKRYERPTDPVWNEYFGSEDVSDDLLEDSEQPKNERT